MFYATSSCSPSRAPARKLTIRPFAKRPSLPPDFFAGAWSRLEAAIDAAHASRPVDDAFETLYRLVQDACLHGRAAELRVKLAVKLAECVRSRVDRTLRRGACPGDPALFVERFERQLRGAANGPPPKVDMPGGSSKPVPELQAEICARFAGIGTSQRRL